MTTTRHLLRRQSTSALEGGSSAARYNRAARLLEADCTGRQGASINASANANLPSNVGVRGSEGSQSQLRPSSSGRLTPKPLLQKSQVEWFMSIQKEEDRAIYDRPWFAEDCRRRFRSLDSEGIEKIGVPQLQGLLKMFPTLSLDLTAEGQIIHAVDEGSVANLLEVFDSDSDGFLSDLDFVELLKFCHAWRSHFYIKAASNVQPAPMVDGSLLGSGLGNGKKKKADAAQHPSPPINRGRRGSGFGPRLLGGWGLEPEKPKVEAAKDDIDLLVEKVPEIEEPAISMKRTDGTAKLAFARRKSCPSAFSVDSSRGSFYSTFASVCHLRYMATSASRESSPGLSSISSNG